MSEEEKAEAGIDPKSYLDFEKALESEKKKRKKIAAGLGLAILLGFSSCAVHTALDQRQETSVTANSIAVEEADLTEAKIVARTFLQTAGSFGLKEGSLTGTNYSSRSRLIAVEDASAEEYYTARYRAYLKLRDSGLLSKQGNLYYTDTTVFGQWPDATRLEKANLTSYSIESIDIEEKPLSSYKIRLSSEEGQQALQLRVHFKSKVSKTVQSATDASWDGTIQTYTTSVDDSLDLTLVKERDSWLVYSIEKNSKPYLLSSWKLPKDSEIKPEGFRVSDSFKLGEGPEPSAKPTASSASTEGTERKPLPLPTETVEGGVID